MSKLGMGVDDRCCPLAFGIGASSHGACPRLPRFSSHLELCLPNILLLVQSRRGGREPSMPFCVTSDGSIHETQMSDERSRSMAETGESKMRPIKLLDLVLLPRSRGCQCNCCAFTEPHFHEIVKAPRWSPDLICICLFNDATRICSARGVCVAPVSCA